MSDITDRITASIGSHEYWQRPDKTWECACGLRYGLKVNLDTHVAQVIVEQLGLIQQWAAAAADPDCPGDWSEFVHTGDYRADAQEDAGALDGGYVVIRYVTKWEAE
jgi:hypothetical protein